MTDDRKRTFLNNLRKISRTYELDEIRVLDTIEQVLARVLAVRYRHGQVIVRLNERTLECDIVEYGRDGHIRIIDAGTLTGLRNLEKHVVRALTEQAAIETATKVYQRYKKNVYLGEVRKITGKGSWWVDLFVSDTSTLVTECPVENQTAHDQASVQLGDVLPFYLSRVRVVGLSRVQVITDRRNKRIPEFLISEALKKYRYDLRVTCSVRRPGLYCEVLTERKLPKEVYTEVFRKIGEPLVVFYGSSEQIAASRRKKKEASTMRHPKVVDQKRGCQ
jgi:hypothetical protein